MGQPVFIKVLGFSDVERHAINSVLRLSQEQAVSYVLWQPGSGPAAQLLLMDGQSHEAALELAGHTLQARELAAKGKEPVKVIWVAPEGTATQPQGVWRSFFRPLHWPDVVQALDEIFAAPPAAATGLDFDVDFDLDGSAEPDPATPTQQGQQGEADNPPTQPGAPGPRALLINPSLEKRYHLRSVMALSGWTVADEATSAIQATELLRSTAYALVVLDLDLPDGAAWQLLAQIPQLQTAPPVLLASTAHSGWLVRWRAWYAGIQATWREPLDSRQLHRKLAAIAHD
ncbi:MAG: response regulator [Burkholderiales bacterium]